MLFAILLLLATVFQATNASVGGTSETWRADGCVEIGPREDWTWTENHLNSPGYGETTCPEHFYLHGIKEEGTATGTTFYISGAICCPLDYAVYGCARGSLEVHDESNHGDVCRTPKADNGNWECPIGCEMTSNSGRPYCLITGTQQECTDIESCADTNVNCPTWATDGECEANPDWMHVNCQLSCGKCDASGSGSDAEALVAEEKNLKLKKAHQKLLSALSSLQN